MFVIDINGNKERCFKLNENELSIYDFDNVKIVNKLQFNKALAGASVNSDIRALRAFYIGMATYVVNHIKIVPSVAGDDINHDMAFRALFRNLGYCINEEITTPFNISLFIDECMNIYNVNVAPLLHSLKIDNVKTEVHHYISGITTSYSTKELDELNNNSTYFISGMANLKLTF